MAASRPDHLLEQARQLATLERGRPRQASLRRAVSCAYYSIFHLLAQDAIRLLVPAADELRGCLLARAFAHEEMAAACRTFSSGGQMPALIAVLYPGLVVRPEIVTVAQAFLDLQRMRHDADYSTHRDWTRIEALTEVERAEQAFAEWGKVRPRGSNAAQAVALTHQDLEVSRLFLTWLLFQKKLQGR